MVDQTKTSFIDDVPPPPGPVVVERFAGDERTAVQRLGQVLGRVADEMVIAGGLALILLPFLGLAALTLDLPFTGFDRLAEIPSIMPSLWISQGELLLALSLPAMLLMTRRHGALLVSRAQGLAWLLLLLLVAVMLLYLSPQLAPGDMPRGLFMLALVISWYVGPQLAIQIYDVMRGGRWWRAPFVAAVVGFWGQAVIFFPLAYGGSGAPWLTWMGADMVIKAGLAAGFLGIYGLSRRRIRPRWGLGG